MRPKQRPTECVVFTTGCQPQASRPQRVLVGLHLLAQANRTEYGEIQRIAERMGITETADLATFGARLLAASQTQGMINPADVVLAAQMAESAQYIGSKTLSADQLTRLRENASQYFSSAKAKKALLAYNNPPHLKLHSGLIVPDVPQLRNRPLAAWGELTKKFGADGTQRLFDANLRGGALQMIRVMDQSGMQQTLVL